MLLSAFVNFFTYIASSYCNYTRTVGRIDRGVMTIFDILVWLLVKHFICDFPLQAHPWLYSRKGIYGASGGIAHALIHGAGSAVVLAALSIDIQLITYLVLAEVVAHYHIDWLKMVLNKKFEWRPTGSEKFWILLGADQLAHHLTYAVIAVLAVS